MSSQTLQLPLFPLNAVLFPHMSLPIHIFESRYKTMISTCRQKSQDFGVVLIKSGAEVSEPAVTHDVGTIARITDVARLDDGQMYIATRGMNRFRILSLQRETPYLLGEVQLLAETEVALQPVVQDVRVLFESYLSQIFLRAGRHLAEIALPEAPDALSYIVAAHLPIDLMRKQQLLEIDSTTFRLQMENMILRRANQYLDTLQSST